MLPFLRVLHTTAEAFVDSLDMLKRTIKDITFPYPIMVGGGVVKTHEQVRALATTDVIAEWGSIETEPSSGNGGRDYFPYYMNVNGIQVLLFALNSRGIPNPGMRYVEEHARDLIKLYEDSGKPLAINVSGKSWEDAAELAKRAVAYGFKVITINGACPNKQGQPILCYDTAAVDMLFERLETEIGKTNALILWKVSAGMPHRALFHNKMRVMTSSVIDGMVTCNTAPNGFYYLPDGAPAIFTDKNHITRGGLSGPAIMPLALDHTQFCADGMSVGKVIFGAGGAGINGNVSTIQDFFRAGATMVQITTAYIESGENPQFITELLTRFVDNQ